MGKAIKERKAESIDHQLSVWFASRNTFVSKQASTEETEASAYRFVTYSFRCDERNKRNVFKKTSFVAESLIKITDPNSIVVIGIKIKLNMRILASQPASAHQYSDPSSADAIVNLLRINTAVNEGTLEQVN